MDMDISNGGTEEHNDERNGNDSSSDDGEADDERTNDGNGRPSPNRRQQISAARGRGIFFIYYLDLDVTFSNYV